MNYVITTDITTDLPESYFNEKNIEILSTIYTVDDKSYSGFELDSRDFFESMRNGSTVSTAQYNPEDARALFKRIIDEKDCDIIHLAFSSGLSGSCTSAKIAADELMEEYPGRKVYVVDTLAASLGEGLFIWYAVKQAEQGMSIDELRDWAETTKLNIGHVFTVDDLKYLHKGGRVSKASAIIGGILNIKPCLHVDNEGHLILIGKVRGRKASLDELVNLMRERIGNYRSKNNEMIMISHGDCEDDANYLASVVKKEFGYNNVLINYLGPTIGSHSGPGTVALFFLCDNR